MGEIKITLETLYDILRNEKKRDDLQELEASFFMDVATYLREKKGLLDLKTESESIFAASEKEKVEYELKSIKRILKEIYEKREKKIIDIALNKSRTGSDIIDTSYMLAEEKEFYNQILSRLDEQRTGVLLTLLKGDLPNVQEKKAVPKVVKEEPKEEGLTKIRFLHATPSFVWKDLKNYGPFEEDEETEIFPEVAELLIRKGRAEKA
ncbi:hypothetical protein COV20_00710 [Candidatus Woesearchaeota archaeon CG10_big_fil_rev_8_21_14_0_10_45_16]|nr:MAG: hypothetical protein COV20_00710 [Candidatus Woesearchaeota archaeon CG10_big_fil_rev_8_21_14_0_10_45_16]